jgi:hypothetical protein
MRCEGAPQQRRAPVYHPLCSLSPHLSCGAISLSPSARLPPAVESPHWPGPRRTARAREGAPPHPCPHPPARARRGREPPWAAAAPRSHTCCMHPMQDSAHKQHPARRSGPASRPASACFPSPIPPRMLPSRAAQQLSARGSSPLPRFSHGSADPCTNQHNQPTCKSPIWHGRPRQPWGPTNGAGKRRGRGRSCSQGSGARGAAAEGCGASEGGRSRFKGRQPSNGAGGQARNAARGALGRPAPKVGPADPRRLIQLLRPSTEGAGVARRMEAWQPPQTRALRAASRGALFQGPAAPAAPPAARWASPARLGRARW